MTDRDPSLAGKTVVITGASRGIGRAIALRFARAGAALGLLARRKRDLERVAEEARAASGARSVDPAPTVACAAADVADPEAVARAAESIRDRLGPIDVVVNNAGAVLRKPFAEIADDEWRRVIAVNLDGAFYVTRAFAADLSARRGRVINISSIAGRQGTPLLTAYCAAKHAVIGLTRALAEEMREQGVSVNALCPGSVDTEMLREGLPDAEPDMRPDDVAQVALFLAAGAPPALTGSCVDVFG